MVERNERAFAMHSMNDERFFNLAMKAIARQDTEAERAELDALMARAPELKQEFERLQADVRTAKDTLPLVEAAQATTGELPAYARGRLQTKVRETLGRPAAGKETSRRLAWGWRWVLGLAATAASNCLRAVVASLCAPAWSPSPAGWGWHFLSTCPGSASAYPPSRPSATSTTCQAMTC